MKKEYLKFLKKMIILKYYQIYIKMILIKQKIQPIFLYIFQMRLLGFQIQLEQFSARDLSSKKISNKYMNKIQNGIVLDLKKPEGIPTEGISFNPNSGVFRFGKETIGNNSV